MKGVGFSWWMLSMWKATRKSIFGHKSLCCSPSQLHRPSPALKPGYISHVALNAFIQSPKHWFHEVGATLAGRATRPGSGYATTTITMTASKPLSLAPGSLSLCPGRYKPKPSTQKSSCQSNRGQPQQKSMLSSERQVFPGLNKSLVKYFPLGSPPKHWQSFQHERCQLAATPRQSATRGSLSSRG